MKVDLISFQDKAVKELRLDMADACDSYHKRGKTQVVSLQAPTGAGKTIIAAALIESIYCGITMADGSTFAEQPEAIFVWLSDSPELNEQSKQKIELKTSKLRFGQCVTISEESFDREMLEDGKIYFLNTQKISKSGNLTKHSDTRQYTIWETLDNTIANKADHLYFIIDEAHRGAKTKAAAGTDTTIMQRFIKGYEYVENGIKRMMRPMPVVLGISATAQRFTTLISNITNVGLLTYVITADDVRASGLLKDRIVITYPDDDTKDNDLVLLEAAVEEWQKKCVRWYQYTFEQHYANVDPVLVVQVCKGTGDALSDTNLEDVLAKIEQKCGTTFKRGEVVHCFGETTKLEINGLEIPHVNASDIAGDHKIKIVLFKEALSTGWDCPRAETMMSFAARRDPTYIAQLLGRMVRTPLQMRVSRDEFLNDVKLYLPHFDKANVKSVIDELQSNEGSEIPTEINGESLAEPAYVNYTAHTQSPKPLKVIEGQTGLFDNPGILPAGADSGNGGKSRPDMPVITGSPTPQVPINKPGDNISAPVVPDPVIIPAPTTTPTIPATPTASGVQLTIEKEITREEIIDFINKQGYLTYLVRHDRINDYLKSLLDLADLLTHNLIYQNARDEVIDDIIGMIHDYVDELHKKGEYNVLASQVLEFRLSVQVFDAFGNEINDVHSDVTMFSENDLDRQLRNADAKLGKYGFPRIYGGTYFDEANPSKYKIDCILFAADENCRYKLGLYAKNKLNEFVNKYRLAIVNKSDSCKKKYHDILADSDIVSEQIFAIPENIVIREDAGGEEYTNHLLAAEKTGVAKIKMNGWESELIEEEAKQDDFVCWLRNPSRSSWGLCLPYDKNGVKNAFYPDFLVVRYDTTVGYVVDVLEPHGNQYSDNLPKAKALAEYAKKEDRFGRIQLIHKASTAAGNIFIRLDLTDPDTQQKVLHANTDDELTNIFATNGISR